MRMGEFLLSKSLIDGEALSTALEVQSISRTKVGRILVELGLLTSIQLDTALSEFLEFKKCEDLGELLAGAVRTEAITSPDELLNGFLVLGNYPVLLSEEFSDVLVSVAEKRESKFRIRKIDPEQRRVLESVAKDTGGGAEKIRPTFDIQEIVKEKLATPYSNLLESLLKEAKEKSASDIHFDGTKDGLDVRFRVLGDLVIAKHVKKELSQSFLAEVKRQTGLPLTVVGSPSSGAARFAQLKLKVRAQSNGQIHGESVVLRLIDEDKMQGAHIENIGADADFVSALKTNVQHANGLILLCGQTGSGKSWTLYSVLMSLDRQSMKVITIEDPVEYEGDGLMQVDVSDGRCSFKDALRSSLRLDPDVIMVGEIRDEETAELAFKAASTGHLVFSTLHTNGAIEAVTRLKGLGIANDLISENLRLVSALTLKKRLCDQCKSEVSGQALEKYGLDVLGLWHQGATFFERDSKGCGANGCLNGATGRILLTESANAEIISSFVAGEVVAGFRDLRQLAIEYAAQGMIGVEDATFA